MIHREKCIVMDIDGSLCPIKASEESYEELQPHRKMVEKLLEYKRQGFYIILYSARNMRTYGGNIGLLNANTSKFTLDWLERHHIPYDEIHFGKPWPGKGGFYVDDKTIRPQEFLNLKYEDILMLLDNHQQQHEASTRAPRIKDMKKTSS